MIGQYDDLWVGTQRIANKRSGDTAPFGVIPRPNRAIYAEAEMVNFSDPQLTEAEAAAEEEARGGRASRAKPYIYVPRSVSDYNAHFNRDFIRY